MAAVTLIFDPVTLKSIDTFLVRWATHMANMHNLGQTTRTLTDQKGPRKYLDLGAGDPKINKIFSETMLNKHV